MAIRLYFLWVKLSCELLKLAEDPQIPTSRVCAWRLFSSCLVYCCRLVTIERRDTWYIPEQSPSFHSRLYLDHALVTKTVNVNYSINCVYICIGALEVPLSSTDDSWSSSSEPVWQILHWSELLEFLLIQTSEIKHALMGLLWDLVFWYSLLKAPRRAI